MKRSRTLLLVASVLLAAPGDAQHYGYDLCKATGVRSGTMYPLLRRLLNAGWLSDGWESQAEAVDRPPRRYYRMTAEGREMLASLVKLAA